MTPEGFYSFQIRAFQGAAPMMIMAIMMAMQIILPPERFKTDCFETLVILFTFISIISAFVKQKLSRIWLVKEQHFNRILGDFTKKGETSMKPATTIVTIFLILVSIVHLLRLIFQWKVTVNAAEIPLWMSAVACIFTAVLAAWLWRENKK